MAFDDHTGGPARDWLRRLAPYKHPRTGRSVMEAALSIGPLLALWIVGALLAPHLPWAALALGILSGAFLIRTFIVQHDCGHGSFLADRRAQAWLGRICGVLTATPYADWRHAHAVHHGEAGDLSGREMGDVWTLTLAEYRAAPLWERVYYRIYRNPVVLFALAPAGLFLIRQRYPYRWNAPARFWVSAMGTNLALAALLGVFWLVGGWAAILAVWLPSVVTAATAGVWLFYVQHQFEDTHWESGEDWDLHEAALHGASHYVLPQPLPWITGNIGIHHVHHLFSRIPFYRLREVLRDHPELAEVNVLTLRESLRCARLHLWDEDSRTLVRFSAA